MDGGSVKRKLPRERREASAASPEDVRQGGQILAFVLDAGHEFVKVDYVDSVSIDCRFMLRTHTAPDLFGIRWLHGANREMALCVDGSGLAKSRLRRGVQGLL